MKKEKEIPVSSGPVGAVQSALPGKGLDDFDPLSEGLAKAPQKPSRPAPPKRPTPPKRPVAPNAPVASRMDAKAKPKVEIIHTTAKKGKQVSLKISNFCYLGLCSLTCNDCFLARGVGTTERFQSSMEESNL